MDQQDRLAYEAAMATLQATRDECLSWLDDPVTPRVERSARWWSLR